MNAVVILLLAATVTWLLRVLFITLLPTPRLPARIQGAFDDLIPAVLAALVVGSLVQGRGAAGLVPVEVAAAAIAGFVAWTSGRLALAVAAGIVAVSILRLL